MTGGAEAAPGFEGEVGTGAVMVVALDVTGDGAGRKIATGAYLACPLPGMSLSPQTATAGGERMIIEYTVGLRLGQRSEALTIEAEDALIAALKVKCQSPEAMITYVRKSNRRGDRRHPHHGLAESATK